ncbi:unnamed protein product [Polarella glacialis]|uniref:Uncharacterized protein n=1 Tax=Polarella glacialis TaxID=89957 RepID=A0A813IBJ8_POLGL|nr:unnamed protein product [Polarella glacialis]
MLLAITAACENECAQICCNNHNHHHHTNINNNSNDDNKNNNFNNFNNNINNNSNNNKNDDNDIVHRASLCTVLMSLLKGCVPWMQLVRIPTNTTTLDATRVNSKSGNSVPWRQLARLSISSLGQNRH